MAQVIIKNVAIKGISSVLGENQIKFEQEPQYYGNNEKQLQKLKKMIGFDTRYWANETTTTADLCEQAAKNLIKELNIEPDSIDAIISVTQTPDYYMPGNAHVIHRNMGFPKTTLAFDIEFGCSGYIYGLWSAYTMINSGLKRILLLTGDTLSKVGNKKDKTVAPIFGDAGCATLLEYDENAGKSYFILKSNGGGIDCLLQPAGAYRTPSSEGTRKEVEDIEGNIRTAENFYMNGFDVFNFTLTEQPKLLDEILEFSGNIKEDIDYFVLHQANVYIVETILNKAKIPLEKAPSKIFAKYGNQNSASIPSAICSDLKDKFVNEKKKVLMQGFGIGLSWGACITDLENTVCLEPTVYKKEGNV